MRKKAFPSRISEKTASKSSIISEGIPFPHLSNKRLFSESPEIPITFQGHKSMYLDSGNNFPKITITGIHLRFKDRTWIKFQRCAPAE